MDRIQIFRKKLSCECVSNVAEVPPTPVSPCLANGPQHTQEKTVAGPTSFMAKSQPGAAGPSGASRDPQHPARNLPISQLRRATIFYMLPMDLKITEILKRDLNVSWPSQVLHKCMAVN